MHSSLRFTVAFAAGLLAVPALAAQSSPQDQAAYHADGVAKAQAMVAQLRAETAAPKRAKVQGNNVYPGTPLANEYRAYPPSCAAWPLPNKPSGQTWTARLPLYVPQNGGSTETVTVTVWRIACSSTGDLRPYNTDGGFNAMTLLRIDRDAANEGKTTATPTFPWLMVKQGSVDYGTAKSLVRAPAEPNTYLADAPFNAVIVNSTTYVLENFSEDALHQYNNAFKLRVDPYMNGVSPIEFTIPDYSPTQSSYPDAYASLPLDGYSAAQWINTQYNEGLLVQITEQLQSNGSTVRQLVFDLLTQDTGHNPLWLVGNAAFAVGQTSLTVDVAYLGNGLSQLSYGKADFEVTDCNHIDVTFHPNANLPAPIPVISGKTTYERLFSPNGMLCE